MDETAKDMKIRRLKEFFDIYSVDVSILQGSHVPSMNVRKRRHGCAIAETRVHSSLQIIPFHG